MMASTRRDLLRVGVAVGAVEVGRCLFDTSEDQPAASTPSVGAGEAAYPDAIWNGAKHPDNPVISLDGNPEAGGEQYEPAIAPDPKTEGVVHCYVKSNELANGTRSLFRLWQSVDGGQSFEITPHTFEPGDLPVCAEQLRNPVLLYSPEKGRWLLYYRCEGGDAEDTVRYAKGTDITTLSDAGEVLTAESVAEDLAMSKPPHNPRLHDIIQVDGTVYFYGAYHNVGANGLPHGFVATSPDLESPPTLRRVILSAKQFPRTGRYIGGFSVVRNKDAFWLITMVGNYGEDAINQRETYAMKGTDPVNFDPVPGVVVDTGEPGSWDEKWAYGGQFFKHQDGEYLTPKRYDGKVRLYYNGQPRSDTAQSWGEIGIIEYDQLPPATVEPIDIDILPFTFDGTVTVDKQSYQNVGISQLFQGPTCHSIRLQGILRAHRSGDTAEAAIETLDANGSRIQQGKSAISTTCGGFDGLIGDPARIEGNAEMVGLVARALDGGVAELGSATVLCYDKALRQDSIR